MAENPKVVVKPRVMVTQGKWQFLQVFGAIILCQDCGEDNACLPFISGGHLETDEDGVVDTKAFVFAPADDGKNTCMYLLYDPKGEHVIADAECPAHLVDLLAAAETLSKVIAKEQKLDIPQ